MPPFSTALIRPPYRLLAFFWLFLAGCALIAPLTFHANTFLTVEIEGFEPNLFQVFYDQGQGLSEADSASMAVPGALDSGRTPKAYIEHLVRDYDFRFARLYFPLPAGQPLRGLRLDPGNRPARVKLREICLENRYQRHCWDAQDMLSAFAPSPDIAGMSVEDGLLTLDMIGNDPQLLYQNNDFAAFYQPFVQDDPLKRLGAYLLLGLACVLGYWLAGIIRASWRTRPAHVFVLLGLVFGLGLVFANPPFQASDEALHFARALHLSQGRLVSEQQAGQVGVKVPPGAVKTAVELATYYGRTDPCRDFDNEKFRYFLDFPPRAGDRQFVVSDILYPPLSYLPQALGLSLGRLLDLSWLQAMYLGRIGNLLFWLACVWWAIRLMPVGRWLLALLALSPVPLYQAASLSVDSVTIALAFLLTAQALQLALDRAARPWLGIGVMLLGIVGIALAKQPYLFLGLLLLLIPARHVGGARRFALWLAAGAGLSLAAVLIWLWQMGHVLDSFQATHDSYAHFQAIVQHPLDYLRLLANTTALQSGALLSSFIGHLGWFDVISRYDLVLPAWLIWLHGLMLVFYALTDAESGLALPARRRALLALVWLAGALIIYTGLYFASTPLDSPVIWGLQGRYFLPMGLLPLLLLYNQRLRLNLHPWLTLAYVPLLLGVTLLVIAMQYYM